MSGVDFDRVMELIVELRSLATHERATRLAEIGAQEPELRAEVETLLAHGLAEAARQTQALVPASALGQARFVPGTMLDRRYRIIGLLGRGGMGEVYHADDMKLGQTVALKFLPAGLERDPKLLDRFINEVRLARQVTHINVCRMYDVGEVDGQHYLSMEYVDGEDLSSLLLRIGRLPEDKAVQVARQIAAGVHAAHEQGILHRDLKPANVMIDGRGQVKITDFGIAGLEAAIRGADIRSGTPAYMAPEQLAGAEVTVRSDIYAMGLVLYELFTGRPAFEADTPDGLARPQRVETPMTPSSHVEGLDRIVEEVILRCLEPEPGDRPSSALAVAAALPGADPLLASLRAGETPSPEMVAAAGEKGLLPRPVAVGLVVVVVASIIGAIALADRVWLIARVAPPKTPVRLGEDAAEMLVRLRGQGLLAEPESGTRDVAFGMQPDSFAALAEQRRALDADRPAALSFWYRESPWALHAEVDGVTLYSVSPFNPPPYQPGMVNLRLDPLGRLLGLTAIPPRFSAAGGDPGPAPEPAPDPAPNWSVLFAEAGLDLDEFTEVTPRWSPPADCDRRVAWLGTPVSDFPADLEVRVEAGAVGAHVVAFLVLMPWEVPDDPVAAGDAPGADVAAMIELPLYVIFMVGGALLAWRNVRRRRGDRRGAWRIVVLVSSGGLVYWFLTISRFPQGAAGFVQDFRRAVATVLFWSATSGLLYFAVEPYIRRRWPQRMIGWSRALAGRWRDPLVGRDLLIGIASGLGVTVLVTAVDVLGRSALGGVEPPPSVAPFQYIDMRTSIGAVIMTAIASPAQAFITLVLVLLFKIVLRRLWLSIVVCGVMGTLLFAPRDSDYLAWGITQFAIEYGVFFLVLFRFGLLAGVAWCFAYGVFEFLPGAPDLFSWYGAPALAGFLALAALAGHGFVVSLAGRPLITDKVLEE